FRGGRRGLEVPVHGGVQRFVGRSSGKARRTTLGVNGTAHRHDQRRVGGVTSPNSSSPAARNPDSKRVLPRHPAAAAVLAAGFAVLLYLIEIVDSAVTADLDKGGIEPRSLGGLEGIIWSPLLHHGWAHLIGNTIPVVVFAFLVMAAGLARWFLVTGI